PARSRAAGRAACRSQPPLPRFFCMPRAWALELGLQLVAHNAMHSLVAQLQTMRLTEPLLHLQVPGKPCRSGETCFELLEDRRRQTLLSRWGAGLFVRQQGLQTARAI